MNSNIKFAENFKERTKQIAVEIIKFCRKLSKSRETFIITDQLIRCSTSVGSNYRAACRARSGREFYSKLCIVVEEADESVYWLEVIEAINIAEDDVNDLIKEGTEILSIIVTSRKPPEENSKTQSFNTQQINSSVTQQFNPSLLQFLKTFL